MPPRAQHMYHRDREIMVTAVRRGFSISSTRLEGAGVFQQLIHAKRPIAAREACMLTKHIRGILLGFVGIRPMSSNNILTTFRVRRTPIDVGGSRPCRLSFTSFRQRWCCCVTVRRFVTGLSCRCCPCCCCYYRVLFFLALTLLLESIARRLVVCRGGRRLTRSVRGPDRG